MPRAIPIEIAPPGFELAADFLDEAEERELLLRVAALDFEEVRMFGPEVIGISLGAACRFYLRRELEGVMRVYRTELPPRSAYLLAGEARSRWQHHLPPVKELRYSITFRTIRNRGRWTSAIGGTETAHRLE